MLNSDLGTLFWFIFTCSALVPQTCVLLGQLTSARRSLCGFPCHNRRLQPSQVLSSHRLPDSLSHRDEILFRALAAAAAAKLHQSCPTLCDPIDGSSPGSPVPGILQARVLEWGAIAFSECLLLTVTSESTSGLPS